MGNKRIDFLRTWNDTQRYGYLLVYKLKNDIPIEVIEDNVGTLKEIYICEDVPCIEPQVTLRSSKFYELYTEITIPKPYIDRRKKSSPNHLINDIELVSKYKVNVNDLYKHSQDVNWDPKNSIIY